MWRKDAQLLSCEKELDNKLAEYFKEIRYFAWKVRTRVFLASYYPLANDAMFDNDIFLCYELLTKFHFPKKIQRRVKLPKNAYPLGRGAQVNYLSSGRLSGKVSTPKSDWHYVKPVRSK